MTQEIQEAFNPDVVVTELTVRYVSRWDRYVLMLPEDYPKGPKWWDGEPIKPGEQMSVIINKPGTAFDLKGLIDWREAE